MKNSTFFILKRTLIRPMFSGQISALTLLLLIILSSFAALAQNAITRNGSFTSSSTEFIDRYGHKSSTPSLTKNGAIWVAIPVALCDASHPTTVVTITSGTGRIWMDRNLGASQAATSATDNEAYGCLYQWGRGNDGHASITRTSASSATAVNGTTTTLATSDSPGNNLFITTRSSPFDWRSPKNDNLWQGVSGTNNPCPSGFKIPTDAEFTAEFTRYSITTAETGYSSIFKFTLPGTREFLSNNINQVGVQGSYWSSTLSSNNVAYHLYRYFESGYTDIGQAPRASSYSVRCIKN